MDYESSIVHDYNAVVLYEGAYLNNRLYFNTISGFYYLMDSIGYSKNDITKIELKKESHLEYMQRTNKIKVDSIPEKDKAKHVPHDSIINRIKELKKKAGKNKKATAEFTYTIENSTYTEDASGNLFLEFKIHIISDQSNTYLLSGGFYLNYSTTVFGQDIVNSSNVTVNRGDLISSTSTYTTFWANDYPNVNNLLEVFAQAGAGSVTKSLVPQQVSSL